MQLSRVCAPSTRPNSLFLSYEALKAKRTKMDLWFCLIERKTGERQWVKPMTWAQADAKNEELRGSGFKWYKSESNKA